MDTQLYCPDEVRKALTRTEGVLNGIDYLEVLDDEAPAGSPRQQTLLAYCFKPVAGLSKSNVRIDGGVRVNPVRVRWAYPASAVPAGLLTAGEQAFMTALSGADRILVARTEEPGDFSMYTFRLVLSATQPDDPPSGFDRLLSTVDFSFKVDCPTDFDCRTAPACPEPALPVPQISYLARDYASFRRLMLDRLAVIMPDWKERNPADLGVALVEVLAYAADHLSYYQDAVATEAYLGTARRRVSARRHARLLDYLLHDGASARAWVCVEVQPGGGADGAILPVGTRVLSREVGAPAAVRPEQLTDVLSRNPLVFETLHDVSLKSQCNAIQFYTWRDPNCCLPWGATRATLHGRAADLDLHEGDVLIFEEVLGPESGRPEDADPVRRHAVRLTSPPEERTDLSNGETVIDIRWHDEDALPFPVCLRQFTDGSGVRQASVARGNAVLADHGLSIEDEELRPAEVPDGRPYRPILQRSDVTHAVPYDDEAARAQPAAAAAGLDPRRAMPQVTLRAGSEVWTPQRDLLNSDRFAPEFVVEMESDDRAYLRFGDGVLGQQPAAGTRFTAAYRIGNGSAGNVGAEALARLVTAVPGISRVRNPLPAVGGLGPEPIEQVRLNAPQAFRSQERAVTDTDYVAAAQRHRDVGRAAATRRWTGSWHTWFVTVDLTGGQQVDEAFAADLQTFLDRFRLAGYDLEIDAPHFVALDIALTVCAAPGYVRSDVRQSLLTAFSNRNLPDGGHGFFHPDNFTFGQPVYLSRVVAAAMGVPGVVWVQPTRFQRWREEPHGELDAGRTTFGRLEIARLDNDPSAPENGRIEFLMQGGL